MAIPGFVILVGLVLRIGWLAARAWRIKGALVR
jgi:hypothetical protein